MAGQPTCLNFEPEWVDGLYLLKHSWCGLPYNHHVRQWETALKRLGSAEHEQFATDGILFSNSEMSKSSQSPVLSHITQDREISTQKYQRTLDQARFDYGFVENDVSLFLIYMANTCRWTMVEKTSNGPWDIVDEELVPYLGIGPAGMQNSDLICRFKNSDSALIIRPLDIFGDFEIIGQARIISGEWTTENETKRSWSPPDFDMYEPSNSHKSSISLSLDLIALQALTRPMEFKN